MGYKVFISREYEPDLISGLVMWKTGANFSHIGIIEDDTTVWHATHTGFHQESVEDFLKEHLFVDKVEIEVENVDFTRGYLRGMEGAEYSASQYLGFAIPLFAKFVANGKEKLVCSEAVIEFLRSCAKRKPRLGAEKDDFFDPPESWAEAQYCGGK